MADVAIVNYGTQSFEDVVWNSKATSGFHVVSTVHDEVFYCSVILL